MTKRCFSVKRRRMTAKRPRASNAFSKRKRSVTKTTRKLQIKTLRRKKMKKKNLKMMSRPKRANRMRTKKKTSLNNHGKRRLRASFLSLMVGTPSLRGGLERSQLPVLFTLS